jgi:hypothetical protein
MTTTVTAKIKGELEERYLEGLENLGEKEAKSKYIREILEAGFYERDVPLFLQLDLPNKVAAQMENERRPGEGDEVVTQRFLREAVDARDADALEAIGVEEGDELRSLVERERDPGESLDDAVRRLVRAGAEHTRDARLRRLGGTWGLKTATGFIAASIIPLALVLTAPGSIAGTAAIVGFMTTALMWVIGFVAIVISIVANILLARPFRSTFGFGIGDAGSDTHATAGE